MPLKISVLLTRSLSAVIFLLLFLGLFWWNDWSFFLLFSIIHWGCWLEYQRLMQRTFPIYQSSKLYYFGLIFLGWGILMIGSGNLAIGSVLLEFVGFTLILCTVFLLPILGILLHSKGVAKRSKMSLLGFFYITLPIFLAVFVGENLFVNSLYGLYLLMLVVLSVWLNDTFAYLVGSLIGRRKFFPKISPNKTWEGTIGGLILGTLGAGYLAYWGYCKFAEQGKISTIYAWLDIDWQSKFANPYFLFSLSFSACLFGTIGDLIESQLKRRAGVKDTGRIMPGHGGFLDRFDSFLLALPATLLAICLWI